MAFLKRFFPIFETKIIGMTLRYFNVFLIVMAVVAVVVFVALFFVDAGYGKFYDKKWGRR